MRSFYPRTCLSTLYASPVMLERRDWNIRQVLWKGAQNSNIAKIHQAGQL
jgi:hypothetical protein